MRFPFPVLTNNPGHAADDPEKLSFPVAEGLWKESRISEDLATEETQELESVEALKTEPEEVDPSVEQECQDEEIADDVLSGGVMTSRTSRPLWPVTPER